MYGIFSQLIHCIDIPNFKNVKDDLVEYCYQQRKKDPEGRIVSNLGGWQSHLEHFDTDNILSSTVKESLSGYFMNDSERIIEPEFGLESRGMWININEKGCSNNEHDHPKCDLTGVIWIKVPQPSERSGLLVLNNSDSFIRVNEMEVYTQNVRKKYIQTYVHSLEPVEGRIVMFPASLRHRVLSNEIDEDRISASFNLIFTVSKEYDPVRKRSS